MENGSYQISSGARIAVIGGGPGGAFFSLYLLHYAGQRNIHPDITIYQQRNFDDLGKKGCKGCAGILSPSLLKNLEEIGLEVPEMVIQNRIEHYIVHSPYASISISNPEDGTQIASIYRGGGPRLSDYGEPISFDGWLLEEAKRRGARAKNQPVSRVYLGDKPKIETAGRTLEYDLVVLAAGVNTRVTPVVGLDYVPPVTETMAQDELYAGQAQVSSRLGNRAHAFLIPHSGIVFGTLVPKGPFINVSVLSSGRRPVSVNEFLSYEMVRRLLPEKYQRSCGCRPKTVVGMACNYYADRFVAVGDAVVSRLYKDGIGSSLLMARAAAFTAVNYGLSRDDFRRHYQPFCNLVRRDNRWGKWLFALNDRTKNSRSFLLAQQRLIADEQNNIRGKQPVTSAMWGMFTGSYSYRHIARMTLNILPLLKLVAALLREGFTGLFRKRDNSPRRLHVGSKKVLILGSGFGGTYALRHLVRSLNRNENIETTMVSNENFFLFSPLLHEVAMGGIETRHIAYPIRKLHWRDRFNFIQAEVENIDLACRKVTTSARVLDFDYLVLALGSVTNQAALNAVGGEKVTTFTLKTLRDSVLIRNHIIDVFERASAEQNPEQRRRLLTFVICGAGYIGIQLVAQLRDLVQRNLLRFYRSIDRDDIHLVLVEAEPKIVAELHTKLGAYTMKNLQDMGIDVRLKSRITAVRENEVEINGQEVMPTNTLIWVAGVVGNPRVSELDVSRDEIGRVVVDEYLEVPGYPGVYAVGDCAHFKDPKTGRPIAQMAHMAVRQARVAADNILAEIRGWDKRPYRFSGTPEILSLGVTKAVMRIFGVRLYGFPARMVWVLAYTLLVTGMYNRIRVLTDWLLSLVFGQDITFLRLKK